MTIKSWDVVNGMFRVPKFNQFINSDFSVNVNPFSFMLLPVAFVPKTKGDLFGLIEINWNYSSEILNRDIQLKNENIRLKLCGIGID